VSANTATATNLHMASLSDDLNLFKKAEKLFKATDSPEAALSAVTFNPRQPSSSTSTSTIVLRGRPCAVVPVPGKAGAYVVMDALCRRMQVELLHHCLADCLAPPNVTNLHAHTSPDEQAKRLVDVWRREQGTLDAVASGAATKLPKHTTLSKLRWVRDDASLSSILPLPTHTHPRAQVTLGYQYDWTARKYYPHAYVPFPAALAALCRELGDLLGNGNRIDPQVPHNLSPLNTRNSFVTTITHSSLEGGDCQLLPRRRGHGRARGRCRVDRRTPRFLAFDWLPLRVPTRCVLG